MVENSTRRSCAHERSHGKSPRAASHRSPRIGPLRRSRAVAVTERNVPHLLRLAGGGTRKAGQRRRSESAKRRRPHSGGQVARPLNQVRIRDSMNAVCDRGVMSAQTIVRRLRDCLALTLRENDQARRMGEPGRKRSWRWPTSARRGSPREYPTSRTRRRARK